MSKRSEIEPYVLLCFVVSAAAYAALSETPAAALHDICRWCAFILSARSISRDG